MMTALEIQKTLGISRNQVKTLMKKYRVAHDGSEQMLYPAGTVSEIIQKEKEKASRISRKRQETSESRREKRSNKARDIISDREMANFFEISQRHIPRFRETFGLVEEPLPRSVFSSFLAGNGKHKAQQFADMVKAEHEAEQARLAEAEKLQYISQSEICKRFGIDRYDIKTAVQIGLLTPTNGNRKFLRSEIQAINPEDFLEKLVWERKYPTVNAANLIGVSTGNFTSLMEKHGIHPAGSFGEGNANLWRYGDFAFLFASIEVEDIIRESNQARLRAKQADEETARQREEDKSRVREHVRVGVRDRKDAPEYTALHLGPTNSGKTYNALENLCEEYERNPIGTYVYAGPLRMLAFEVYEKLAERYGAENVGFITGEEQVNPDAPILATTVEMAPVEGDVLIIDEAHWIIDDDRGHYWTKLLIGAKFRRIHVIAAREVKDDILPLVRDSWEVESFEYERRTGITFDGTIPLAKVPAKTAVVCFSRRSVYAMAGALKDAGKSVGVLYGALPLQARKEQVRKFVEGEFDIVVTTDVIGHGINLPIDNVVFAETEKFDGKVRRDLYSWEAGQIAGRAGRFGLSDKGRVYLLTGRKWFSTDADLVKQGVAVAGGLLPSDLAVDKPLVAPRLADLGLLDNDQIHLNYALDVWREKATELLEPRGIKPSSLETLRKNLEAVAFSVDCYLNEGDAGMKVTTPMGNRTLNRRGTWKMEMDHLWQLVSGPFSADSPVLESTARWLNDGSDTKSSLIADCFRDHVSFGAFVSTDDIQCLEKASQSNSELKMVALMFANECGRLGVFNINQLTKAEKSINKKIIKLLNDTISTETYGECSSCGDECLPWFKYCNDCYENR